MDVLETLVEVKLKEREDFLKVKETLTRIGVSSKKEKKLFQSCHILHKQGLYYIVHFKELFALDGKPTDFDDEDMGRRNTIASLLEEWNLVQVVDGERVKEPRAPMSRIKILSHKEKPEWTLVSKYNIGKTRKQN
jgi:Bacteriophage translational regulator